MGIGGVNAANDMMMAMMQTLMRGMEESVDMSRKMVAINAENHFIGVKMDIAQDIIRQNSIDVYA